VESDNLVDTVSVLMTFVRVSVIERVPPEGMVIVWVVVFFLEGTLNVAFVVMLLPVGFEITA
jgi:hypothetical protein